MAWTQFLTRLRLLWRDISTKWFANNEPSTTLPAVLGRFIDDKRNVSPTGRVKRRAFDPPQSNLRLSVYRIDGLAETQIWLMADRFVGQVKNRAVIGRAEFLETLLAPLGLRAEIDPHPHPLHMNVLGWPTEKDARIALALELAAQSMYVARTASPGSEPVRA